MDASLSSLIKWMNKGEKYFSQRILFSHGNWLATDLKNLQMWTVVVGLHSSVAVAMRSQLFVSFIAEICLLLSLKSISIEGEIFLSAAISDRQEEVEKNPFVPKLNLSSSKRWEKLEKGEWNLMNDVSIHASLVSHPISWNCGNLEISFCLCRQLKCNSHGKEAEIMRWGKRVSGKRWRKWKGICYFLSVPLLHGNVCLLSVILRELRIFAKDIWCLHCSLFLISFVA